MIIFIIIFIQFSLFLTIGVMLYVYHSTLGIPPPDPLDRLYPSFIWNELPPVAAGVVIAAILAAAMSNISAALNSLASATMMDLVLPRWGSRFSSEQSKLTAARWATVGWGVVLMSIAVVAREWGSVLEAGLAIASVPLGALLGVFSLGTLTKRVDERAALFGMGVGLAAILYVTFETSVAWSWYVAVGATTTFCVGWASSFFFGPPKQANT